MSIVNRIREEGKKYNLSIASIEKNLNISNGTIGKWNTSKPSAENLYNVAKLLHCSMEYLLEGENKYEHISRDEQEWLELYKQLSCCTENVQHECIGFIKGYISRGTIE